MGKTSLLRNHDFPALLTENLSVLVHNFQMLRESKMMDPLSKMVIHHILQQDTAETFLIKKKTSKFYKYDLCFPLLCFRKLPKNNVYLNTPTLCSILLALTTKSSSYKRVNLKGHFYAIFYHLPCDLLYPVSYCLSPHRRASFSFLRRKRTVLKGFEDYRWIFHSL